MKKMKNKIILASSSPRRKELFDKYGIDYTVDFVETEEFGDTDFYNEIAYTGGIYDESTSLYYLNARYYNPEDARFITQDTYRGQSDESTSLHLYAYCANDPINYIDPSGHSKWRYGGYGIQVAISIPFIDLALDIVWFSRNVKGFNYIFTI